MDEILLLQLKDIDIRNIFHKRNSTLLEDRVSGCRLYVGCRASIKFLIFLLTRERGGEGRFCCSSLSLTGGTKVRRNENYIETKFQARLSLSLSLSCSVSLFPLPSRATGVLLRIFRLHCLLRYHIESPLITNQSFSSPLPKISKGFLLQNFIVTFQYRISSSFQDGV